MGSSADLEMGRGWEGRERQKLLAAGYRGWELAGEGDTVVTRDEDGTGDNG